MTSLRQDVTFALRTLRRRRAFAAVAITTIALGIGAATAIYSVVDGVLFRPLPFRESGRLISVWHTYPRWRNEPVLAYMWDRIPFSIPEYRDWRAAQTVFSDVAIYADRRERLLGGSDAPEMVRVTRASASLLNVLGVSPALGRYFTPQEDVLGGSPVAMVSWNAWQSRFQGSPDVLGKIVRFDNEPYTIIGVLPKGLSLSRSSAGSEAPFWTPVGQEAQDANQRGNHSYRGLGRLKPGVTLAQATTETDRILRGDETPDRLGVRLDEWQVDQTRNVRKPLLVLLGAVGLLLLIACVNVAVLMLGEATGREHEIAARIALGAGRRRIIAQLLTEAVVLSAVGGVVGTLLAVAGTRVLVALAPGGIPGLATVGIDLRVLAFALVAAGGTGILFGLAPAIALGRSSASQVLRGTSGQSVRGRGALQRVMVSAELALSLMLLVGAALLSRSLERLTAVDPGFRADHLLAVRVSLPTTAYPDTAAVLEFYRAALARLDAIPGVSAATASSTSPFSGGSSSSSIEIEGRPLAADEQHPEVQQRIVVPGFFRTMGIPILSGRAFDANDRLGSTLVVLVSQAEARRDFPNESPIGKRVRFQSEWREVVGVVGDIKYSQLSADFQPTLYTPFAQRPSPYLGLTLLLRTTMEPASLTSAAREVLHEVAPAAPFLGANTMTELIRRSSAEERYRTLLISIFGALAAVLAAVGMYGVTARAVSRRTREMGIRIALGATSGNVTAVLLRYTLAGVAAGVATGLIGAVFASRALEPYLFGIDATDGIAYLGSVALLGLVSIVASWVPSRRATHVEPAIVLRGE